MEGQSKKQEPQAKNGLQDIPLQSFSLSPSEGLSVFDVVEQVSIQQLCSALLFNKTKSIPGLKAKNKIVIINIIVRNFIALQRYKSLYCYSM